MPRRRWFQYSLRSFLVLLTVLGVWLGFIVNRAREQREAVRAIEAMGADIHYSWQGMDIRADANHRWVYSRTLGRKHEERNGFAEVIGDDFFHYVDGVVLRYEGQPIRNSDEMYKSIRNALPYLKRLHGLTNVFLEVQRVSGGVRVGDPVGSLKNELPSVEVFEVHPRIRTY